MAGVRGESSCADCCRFPVLARPIEGGEYEVYYDREGTEGTAQASSEGCRICRGRARGEALRQLRRSDDRPCRFVLLSDWIGLRTREVLKEGLGGRGREFRVGQLLKRLDELFRGSSQRENLREGGSLSEEQRKRLTEMAACAG